jgi:septal ring factor EnvC (AmiA/AmiB activator)
MEDRKSYLQKMADQLKQWDTKIDELKAKVVKTKAESKAGLLNQIDDLNAKKETTSDKLKQLQAAGEGTWDDMKAGLEKSWIDFKSTFSKVSTRFK